MGQYILAVDQGTSSTKALVIGGDGRVVATSAPLRFEVEPNYPQAGWVEYDPEQIWETVRASARAALRAAGLEANDIAGLGLANQGETVVAFDSETGDPIYPAISWQDCRGKELTDRWHKDGVEDKVFAVSGLRLDPYFSAPKLAWILRHVDKAQELHAVGRLRLGTSDAWLLWRLTGGRRFVTDAATASRTMLMDLHSLQWNAELARVFGIPLSALPEICANATEIGTTDSVAFGTDIPITGICVDQQAALFGCRAFNAGQAKITYGTGCFFQANIGSDPSRRANGLLTSVGWLLDGECTFVFDGGVYSAGSLVEWLVELGFVSDVAEIGQLASEASGPSSVILIPAFSGLGAPRWSSGARACWLGMDQGTHRRHLVRSALEAIAYRVREIIDVAISADVRLQRVQADGGLTQCDFLMQLQSDLLRLPLTRNDLTEATALGVGYLAGLGSGRWAAPFEIPSPSVDSKTFQPRGQSSDDYEIAFERWKQVCSSIVDMGDAGLFEGGF